MENLTVPRILVSGIAPGVGKSLLVVGLLMALRKRGISVSVSVCGSALMTSVLYRRLSGRNVRSLDAEILTNEQMLAGIGRAAVGADFLLIDGSRGLYDGYVPGTLHGSDAQIAAMTRTPTLLVVDNASIGTTQGVILQGLFRAAQGFPIAGTIFNRTRALDDAENHEVLDALLQAFHLPENLGSLPLLEHGETLPALRVSQEKNTLSLSRQFFIDVGALVADHIDLDRVLESAAKAEPLQIPGMGEVPQTRRAKIAVSDDPCFSLSFQDNLDLLRFYGAEVVSFSPLADMTIPRKVGAVYLTGGFIEEYAGELAANESMRRAIRDFASSGGVIYSEGAGTAYLCEEFQVLEGGAVYPGVGVLPGRAIRRGSTNIHYIQTLAVEDTVIGPEGGVTKGISSEEWQLASEASVMSGLRMTFQSGGTRVDGYSPGAQILSTFSFLHWGSNPAIAAHVVEAAAVVAKL